MSELDIIGGTSFAGEEDHEKIHERLERRRIGNSDARMDGGTPSTSKLPSFLLAREINVAPEEQTQVE